MGRKSAKARRAAAKRARRAEEEARRAEEERDTEEVNRLFNNPDWKEFAACPDMPGRVLTKKKPLDPELTRCACCDKEWCTGMCKTCDNSPAYLPCPCAPTFCQECMLTHANTNRVQCVDPACERHHFNCPTCRKFLCFYNPNGCSFVSCLFVFSVCSVHSQHVRDISLHSIPSKT